MLNIQQFILRVFFDNLTYFYNHIYSWCVNWINTLDHNTLGMSYILFGVFCGFFGALMSLAIRIELLLPGYFLFSGSELVYNVSITSHGLIMIFFAVMPIFISGFGNYFLPLMLGCSDMAMPSLNNSAFFFLLFSFIILNISLGSFGHNFNGVSSGWTMYPPLSITSNVNSVVVLIVAIHLNGVSSILNALNTVSTLQFCSSICNWHYNMFCWSLLVTSYLLILVLPIFVVAVTFLLLDLVIGSCFFSVEGGGDPILFQHLFWLFGHPEVYILILPVFGLVSELICENTSSNLLGYKVMIWSMLTIAFLGCLVWAHHMFTVGLDVDSNCYFTIASSLISIPTGLNVVLWLSSYFSSYINYNIVNIYILLFITNFIFGGITGVWIAQAGLDLLLHDTYFVVAHFHYVMAISIIYIFFACMYNWFNLFFGLSFNVLFANVHTILFFIGANLTFAPMHVLGFLGMPSSIFDYPSCFILLNQLSTFGSIVSIISVLWFLLALFGDFSYISKLLVFCNNIFY